MTKAEYKKHHCKVVEYIYAEYRDFHFNRMKNGSLLIQLNPTDKHLFHLLIKTLSNPKNSINNIAAHVVEEMWQCLWGKSKVRS
jgi:L-rhamnose mutarotase